MSDSTNAKNWIEYQNIKHSVPDFISHFQDSDIDILRAIATFIKEWFSNSNYINQKTSGSTGKPKLIEISKDQMRASSKATLDTLGLEEGDTAMLSLNPDFIGGKMMIVRALTGNLNLVITSVAANPFIDLKSTESIDFFSFVPYQLERILDESPEKAGLLERAKATILGGSAVSEMLTAKINAQLSKAVVYSTYGMTETVSHVALKKINPEHTEYYEALKDIEFSIDMENRLIIKAPKISGMDILKTNDVVELITSTKFKWLGRYDNVINSGGIKIHPELVEKQISILFKEMNITNRFFTFGLPDDKLGEALYMIMEGDYNVKALQTKLKSSLKSYQAPKRIYTVENFVETDSGKISRPKTIEKLKQSTK